MSNLKFAKLVVLINALVPGAILLADALRGQLGANPVNFAIRTTGFLSLTFLALCLAATPLRRLTGYGSLVAFRKPLGLFSFYYVAAHFIIFFYWDRMASITGTLSEMVTRKYLIVGSVGLILLTILAATSFNFAMRLMGPANWKRLHRLVYVAAIAGAVHYFMLVKADISWPVAFFAVFGVLLGFRAVAFFVPEKPAIKSKRRFWRGTMRVISVRDETHDVKTFRLSTEGGLPFDYQPGQYLNLSLQIDGKRVNRSYTISSSPSRSGHVEITVKRDGVASCYLHDHLKAGDAVMVSAPSGRFTFTGTEAPGLLLIAGGVGITPMMSVIRYLCDRNWSGPIDLLYSSKTGRDIIFQAELRELASRHPNLKLHFTLTRSDTTDWQGLTGRLDAKSIQKLVPQFAGRRVHVCGPSSMMQPMLEALHSLGVAEGDLRTEEFKSPTGDATSATAEVSANGQANLGSDQPQEVTLTKSKKTLRVDPGLTILEAAEEAGVDLPFDCRSGICGTCKCGLTGGKVVMDSTEALSPHERDNGYVLTCQARPTTGVTLDL